MNAEPLPTVLVTLMSPFIARKAAGRFGRQLEAELSKLKRMYADLALENRAMKDLIAKKL